MAVLLAFLAAFAYSIGGVVCHQLPDRSFFLAGRQLPVCARCTGLYLGVAAGLLGWFLVRRMRASRPVNPRVALNAFAIAVVPTAVSWATGIIGAWDGSNVIRAVLAVPLGVAAGASVAAVAAKDLR